MNASDRVLSAGSESLRLALAGDKVASLHVIVSNHLADIAGLFKSDVKLTLVARSPDHPDGSRDVIVTSDSIDGAIAALRLRADA